MGDKTGSEGAAGWAPLPVGVELEGAAAWVPLPTRLDLEGAAAGVPVVVGCDSEGAATWVPLQVGVDSEGLQHQCCSLWELIQMGLQHGRHCWGLEGAEPDELRGQDQRR